MLFFTSAPEITVAPSSPILLPMVEGMKMGRICIFVLLWPLVCIQWPFCFLSTLSRWLWDLSFQICLLQLKNEAEHPYCYYVNQGKVNMNNGFVCFQCSSDDFCAFNPNVVTCIDIYNMMWVLVYLNVLFHRCENKFVELRVFSKRLPE